jgi:general secretion pathway protein D
MFPIVNTTAGTANTTGGSTISYTNLTVNLDVTPRIAANDYIELKVQQGVLRLGPNFTSTVGGVANDVNSFLTRKLDTTVLIPSGNTLVMGGLIQDTTGNNSTKVPLLGDIPGLGGLFRKDSKSLDRQNLTIFITPTVVGTNDFQVSKSDYLTKAHDKTELKDDWSAWDSGRKKEWGKKKTASYK